MRVTRWDDALRFAFGTAAPHLSAAALVACASLVMGWWGVGAGLLVGGAVAWWKHTAPE